MCVDRPWPVQRTPDVNMGFRRMVAGGTLNQYLPSDHLL